MQQLLSQERRGSGDAAEAWWVQQCGPEGRGACWDLADWMLGLREIKSDF